MRKQVISCDRCTDPVPDDSDNRDKSGRVYAATLAGTDKVGTSTVAADLCGGCLDDLVLFMNGRALERPLAKAKERTTA